MDACPVELFYAQIEAYGLIDTMEGITELSVVSVADFEAMIRENVITDGFTIATYARAMLTIQKASKRQVAWQPASLTPSVLSALYFFVQRMKTIVSSYRNDIAVPRMMGL